MNTTIKLPGSVVEEAKKYSVLYDRSVPKQITHWCKIGKIAEENPDLSYNLIKDMLFSLQEAEQGEISEYQFG